MTACMAAVESVHATEHVLKPIADTWLREVSPGSANDADFVSVWARGIDPAEGNNARYGVLSFDLSGVTQPIASARLEFYMVELLAEHRVSVQAGSATGGAGHRERQRADMEWLSRGKPHGNPTRRASGSTICRPTTP